MGICPGKTPVPGQGSESLLGLHMYTKFGHAAPRVRNYTQVYHTQPDLCIFLTLLLQCKYVSTIHYFFQCQVDEDKQHLIVRT